MTEREEMNDPLFDEVVRRAWEGDGGPVEGVRHEDGSTTIVEHSNGMPEGYNPTPPPLPGQFNHDAPSPREWLEEMHDRRKRVLLVTLALVWAAIAVAWIVTEVTRG